MQRGDSEVVAETKAGNITKEDLYQTLKDNAGADALNMLVQTKYSMINTMSPTKKSTKAERVQNQWVTSSTSSLTKRRRLRQRTDQIRTSDAKAARIT
ncbi:hypothetical protein PO124_22245 [Bacillus licheniformis]|nr:hypothetical protein [Bacillus licheniformis]